MSLTRNNGMNAIWSMCAIVIAILLIYFLGSMSFMFPANTITLLQYLILTFAISAVIMLW